MIKKSILLLATSILTPSSYFFSVEGRDRDVLGSVFGYYPLL